LIDRKNLAFRSGFIGKTLSAVTLIADKSAHSQQGSALTDNFLPVTLEDVCGANDMVSIQITATTSHGLAGTLSVHRVETLSTVMGQRA
jgi:hypothetical protein